ncbi:DUF2059 domain-containing protein [Salinarimonas soli]|uniref:DUF2059 domain-containing protein n=1 Tax=Salinarimonas soli TaxID=1638099 RepID=A0A5B2VF09_9HYPH|nr:DUF2059 domain-containing protein [Salinarimonas soli]KAA2237030.1 DUF2059 domain-containing protein [Salinarimonas soli]
MTRPAYRLAATLLALALPLGAAHAQTPPRPAATAGQPSAAQLAVARDIVTASGMSRSFEPMIPALMDQLKQAMVTRPEVTKDLDEVLNGLKPELDQQRQIMFNTAARIYATSLTEAELKDVLAFFKSPAGVRYVATQPAVLDELVREMQKWSQGVAEYMMVRVRAEMGKRGHAMQ